MQRQTRQLARLVDDLMDASRITRDQLVLNLESLELGNTIRELAETWRPVATSLGLELSVRVPREKLYAHADPVRIAQIVSNLLSNACKYTNAGGHVELRIGRDGDVAVLTVSDDGSGISPDLLPRVFDIFTQDRRGLDRAEGGLGLGLAISKRLVEMHDGTITAHSAGSGCGSEFVVRPPALPAGSGETAGLTVMVIDDNADAAATLRALVEINGHRCVVAHEGEAGLALAREALPDVVLLDIGLPGMNGYEVARRLRSIPALDGVMVVAVTGYATEDDRQRALDAGFDVHLSKPVSYEQLVQRLQMLGPAAAGDG
jgi:CheY-like chemotaxis protein/two-component sensor histidine kinase